MELLITIAILCQKHPSMDEILSAKWKRDLSQSIAKVKKYILRILAFLSCRAGRKLASMSCKARGGRCD